MDVMGTQDMRLGGCVHNTRATRCGLGCAHERVHVFFGSRVCVSMRRKWQGDGEEKMGWWGEFCILAFCIPQARTSGWEGVLCHHQPIATRDAYPASSIKPPLSLLHLFCVALVLGREKIRFPTSCCNIGFSDFSMTRSIRARKHTSDM